MNEEPSADVLGLTKPRVRRFRDLMRNRVRQILVVSSLYDSFILTEDGHLNEALLRQFVDFNLSQNPDLVRVSTGGEALARVRKADPKFDLIVTSMQVGDMDAVDLAQRVADEGLDVPVIMLAFNNRELTDFGAKRDLGALERVFLWQGDVRIMLAIVKYVEDRLNLAHDTGQMGVPAIIVVEDNVRYYSSFLPMIYAELMDHTHDLISEGLNLSQKMMRMRARAKVLLCSTFEEAWHYITACKGQVLGVISDIEFPWHGALHRTAGVELAKRIHTTLPDVPIMLQSSFPGNEELAESVGASFLLKGSPVLLHQLRRFIVEGLGFGDFTFRLADGTEIDRAHNLKSLVEKLRTVPAESIGYHGERNHFSNWLKARTEFDLADKLRPRTVAEFRSLEHLRQDLIRAISEYRVVRDRAIVADFDRATFDSTSNISRIGSGSLGGKARGLAFVNRLLSEYDVAEKFPDVRISVPFSVVLGTGVFDEFIESNELRDFAIAATSDAEIEERFLDAPFPEEPTRDLQAFLRTARYPLAVRSSGLLEDSPSQPFAGIYQTYMVPNDHADPHVRLEHLIAAVKRVYASTFSVRAKGFLEMTSYRLEEEKMAVMIQKVVGAAHGPRFYPDFAGVARSHNFYPIAPLKSEDGIVAVALGLGRWVVDGGDCLRFSPRYPRHTVEFSSAEEALKNSQREFFAIELGEPGLDDDNGLIEQRRFGLKTAEEDGTLAALGSTYSPDNDVVYEGLSRPGVRLVSFAPVLKHDVFPLAEVLEALMAIGTEGTSSPVEIEFAVNLSVPAGGRPELGFLQMRPLALSSESEELEIGDVLSSDVVCRSSRVMGHGRVSGLREVVVVDYHKFDRMRSHEVAEQVAGINATLQHRGQAYVLIGVGRWGSADPFLGIPVSWNQIAGARVIVEAGFKDFKVEPSQGTHFFQNLTSCNVGYFTVNPEAGEGFIDWDWLSEQPAVEATEFVRHVRLVDPLVVLMSGQTGDGVILKSDTGTGQQ